MIQRLDRAFLENFLKECFAKCCRQVIDKSCDTKIVIRNDILVSIEHLSYLESYLCFLEASCQILYALYYCSYTYSNSCIEFT